MRSLITLRWLAAQACIIRQPGELMLVIWLTIIQDITQIS